MTTRRPDAPQSMTTQHDDDAPPASGLSSMQRAIMTIQKMRAKIENLERARVEPIAIIGMGCRFPGGASTPEAFFELLKEGVDAITEVPPERWGLAPEQSTDPEARAVRWGAFLRDVDLFDARFFGISPREAAKMDPQQRLLLEVTWEALERAGQVPERLVGSRTGVFLGIMNNDYAEISADAGPEQEDAYTTTGNGHSFPSGRISYTFGFQGPNLAVDTACSSSLVAIHLACNSLRSGECTMAVAGGVNLMLAPSTTRKYAKLQALSPDGRCKTFDATANGFVRGEGCGMVVLKRLSDAERDGDSILAIIRGSAVNQDGRSTGLTTPNVLAQQAMLTQALEASRLSPADVGYVETHGTGTSLGDPIEVDALKAVLGGPRSDGSACVLGALKTNIGHLESAAGVAGLMKAVLVLQNGVIPKNNHFRTLNPRIQLDRTPFVIPTEARPWRTALKRRIAGVSSFGLSGTNAHLIVEEWPQTPEEDLAPEASAYLVPLSAKSPEALRALAEAYRKYLSGPQVEARLRDIVYTASHRRGHFEHRLSVVGSTREELTRLLSSFLAGESTPGIAAGKSTPARAKIVFVFSGQGSQWLGMGRKLYEEESAYRSVIDSCDALLTGRLGWSILDELDSIETMSRMSETQVAQPLIFALQIALVELLRSWGIAPDAVIGHGVGEIAAAHIAGILSLDEAIRLVAIRGRIMQKASGATKTVAAAAPVDVVRKAIAGYEDRILVGAVNDHESVVLAGQIFAMDEVVAKLERQGISCEALPATYTFQGPHMEPAARDLIERLARVDARRATLAMYSTVLGECVEGKELDVRYWGRNVRETVLLEAAVGAAIHDGYQLFLEVGPDPVLVRHLQNCLASKGVPGGLAVASLQRHRDDRRALLEATGALYTRGCAVEWQRVIPQGGRTVVLPTYPWQRTRFWIDPPPAPPPAARTTARPRARTRERPRVVFVFPGQGSQWLGMGRQLLAEEPAFRAAIEACDAAIQHEAQFSVLAELEADEGGSRLGEIDIIQPVLFAIEVALASLWKTWGVIPDAVIGHSMGEVAAAHVAGKLDLADAAKVICRRSRLLRRISGQGAMALVELRMAEAQQALAGYEDRLGVAVSNGPRSTVLSGDPAALEEVLQALEAKGVFCRRVKVDVASHSPQVDPLRASLLSALAELSPRKSETVMISTVTGEPVRGPELTAGYWVNNLREPVRFSHVTQHLMREGYGLFIEMSPHPILVPSIEENLEETGRKGAVIASVRRQSNERQCMQEAVAMVEAQGYATGRVLAAPPRALPREAGGDHPLLGRRIETSARRGATIWQNEWSLEALPWLADHRVGGRIVLPGSVYIEAALSAARERIGDGAIVLEGLALVSPLVVPEEEGTLVEVVLAREDGDDWSFEMSSRVKSEEVSTKAPSAWVLHASARLRVGRAAAASPPVKPSLPALQARCGTPVPLADARRAEAQRGIEIGPSFDALSELWRGDAEALGRLRLPGVSTAGDDYVVHPALLDAALRVTLVLQPEEKTRTPHVLSSVRRVHFHERVQSEAWCHCRQSASEGAGATLDLVDEAGRSLLTLEGIETRALPPTAAAGEDPLADLFFEQRWEAAPLSVELGRDAAAGRWLVLCDDSGIGERTRDLLVERGGDVRCAWARRHDAEPRNDRVEVDPGDPERVAALVEEAFRDKVRPMGVVCLWGLEPSRHESVALEGLGPSIVRGSVGALHVAQSLARVRLREKPRLWLVVRGTQAVGEGPHDLALAPSATWGLGRALAVEAWDLRCARVDLDPRGGASEAMSLVRELIQDGPEEEIALRGDKRYCGRIDRARPGAGLPGVVRSDGTYLVTGGLGTLGLLTARWLVARGARHIALQGRRGVTTSEQERALAALRAEGAEVHVLQVDVTDLPMLEASLRSLAERTPPLRGVVHAAGNLDSAALADQSMQVFRSVLAPKVEGAVALHLATRDAPLDFFIMYSSIVGLLGSMGMASYVAANVFLDSLARKLRSAGRPALSIPWGFFADVGHGLEMNRNERVTRQGLGAMSGDDLGTYLDRLVGAPDACVGVAAIDPRQWLDFHPQMTTSPRITSLLKIKRAAAQANPEDRGAMLRVLRAAKPGERTTLMEEFVRQQVAKVLRMDPALIETRAPLRALGIDSLMALELRNQLERSLETTLAATLVFTYPHVSAIAQHLLSKIDPSPAPVEPEGPAVALPSPLSDDTPAMFAEDDALAELDRELFLAKVKKS